MPTRFERFSPPLIGSKIIERNDIITQLNRMPKRGIIFLHAPAGYGKTTAAALWLRSKDTAWLSLDEYSVAPADIYKWLLFALSCETPCEFTNAPLQCMLDTLQTLNKWPEALVIDDFHLCTDSSVAKALPLIRARLPADMAFVVLSRNPPPAILDEQVLKGVVNQITDLQFSCDEIIKLFDKNKVTISKLNAELLQKQTGGWGAALSAVLMSHKSDKQFLGVLNRDTLNHYLRSHVFDYWNNYHILKKCSICDTLNPNLCIAITGQEDAWNVIEELADKTGLVMKLSNNTERFHDLLKDFLEAELQNDDDIDKPRLYKAAAIWYKNNRDFLHALDMAAKSRDIEVMEEISRTTDAVYGEFGMDVDGYVQFIEERLLSDIPNRITEQYPRLSILCSHGAFLSRPIEEALFWLDVLEKHIEARRNHREDNITAAFLLAIDPRHSSWHVPRQFERISRMLSVTKSETRAFTLTQNLPFFHKAQRDYTDIASELPVFIAEITQQMTPILGSFFKPLVTLLEAGIYYERGQLAQAEQIALESCQISEHFSPEIKFSSFALYFEILRVQGKSIEINHIAMMLAETNATYLVPNFNAYTTLLQLMNGDRIAAAAWLKQQDTIGTLKFYKIFQYFTTARAMMVMGELSTAEKLLERLAIFSQNYHRNADNIEALTLIAICRWYMKRTDDAVKAINSAIIKAAKLQLVIPIIKEGKDVFPILQKVLNRLKYGYDSDILDKAFTNTLFFGARTMSQHVRGMLTVNKTKPVKLSPRQKEVLKYLGQNLSYREIGDKIGVKVTTVVDHIGKLYQKLGVSNAHDAVLKAREIGLIDTI